MPTNFGKKLALSFALIFILAGCSTPFVNPPRPAYLTKQAGQGAASGTVLGAFAGGVAGATPVGMAAAGAVVGTSIGADLVSTHHLLTKLQGYGVQVIQVGDKVTIVMPSDYVFIFNTATIRTSAMPMLNTTILLLDRYGHVNMKIAAYTDDTLSPTSAFDLTRKQAKSIAAYFWSYGGWPFNLVDPIGKGNLDDIATNGNSMGSYYNRRIMITLPVVPMHASPDIYNNGQG